MKKIRACWTAWFVALMFTVCSFVVMPHNTYAAQFTPKNIQTDLSMTLTNQYVWRGVANEDTKDDVCLQPSLTFSYGGAFANIWQNIDTANWGRSSRGDSLTETDLTFGYGKTIGKYYFESGYTYYAYDQQKDGQEVYIMGQLDSFLKPALTIYQDFAHYPATFINLGVSQPVPVLSTGMTLTLGASMDYLISGDKDAYPDGNNLDKKFNGFYDGLLSASLDIPVTKMITVTPQVYWSFPVSGDAKPLVDNYVYGAISVDVAF